MLPEWHRQRDIWQIFGIEMSQVNIIGNFLISSPAKNAAAGARVVRANAVPKIPVPMMPILFISFPRCRCCLLTLILYAAGLNTSKYFI